jgi:hypothetical protein
MERRVPLGRRFSNKTNRNEMARGEERKVTMRSTNTNVTIRINVEYDAYNRMFKLLDRELGSVLEDGGLYELKVPFGVAVVSEDEEFVLGAPLAHA